MNFLHFCVLSKGKWFFFRKIYSHHWSLRKCSVKIFFSTSTHGKDKYRNGRILHCRICTCCIDILSCMHVLNRFLFRQSVTSIHLLYYLILCRKYVYSVLLLLAIIPQMDLIWGPDSCTITVHHTWALIEYHIHYLFNWVILLLIQVDHKMFM